MWDQTGVPTGSQIVEGIGEDHTEDRTVVPTEGRTEVDSEVEYVDQRVVLIKV